MGHVRDKRLTAMRHYVVVVIALLCLSLCDCAVTVGKHSVDEASRFAGDKSTSDEADRGDAASLNSGNNIAGSGESPSVDFDGFLLPATMTSPSEPGGGKDEPQEYETKQTILIGVCALTAIALMFVVTKFRRIIRACRSAQQEDEEESEEDSNKMQDITATVYVQYDLWDNGPDVKTVSGALAQLSSRPSRHVRPYDKRTATSYRQSFRIFKKRKEDAEPASDSSLPTYRNVIKKHIGEFDLPPLYWELPHDRAGTSGVENGAFAPGPTDVQEPPAEGDSIENSPPSFSESLSIERIV